MNKQEFTKYETARIIGARALQIAMDAPLLLKISEDELKKLKYDALRIAELEFEGDVLPINVTRPNPKRRKDRLSAVKEEVVSDEELVQKEKEAEKEIAEGAEEMGLIAGDEVEDFVDESPSSTGSEESG